MSWSIARIAFHPKSSYAFSISTLISILGRGGEGCWCGFGSNSKECMISWTVTILSKLDQPTIKPFFSIPTNLWITNFKRLVRTLEIIL